MIRITAGKGIVSEEGSHDYKAGHIKKHSSILIGVQIIFYKDYKSLN
jgi:hypothetical protein